LRPFAELLDRLSLTTSRNAKLVLLRDYLKATPDPDRGWALAALTGELSFTAAKPAMIRKAVEVRVDPILFGWSYDYVGDLAETTALIWPRDPSHRANREPDLGEVVDALLRANRADAPVLIEGWLARQAYMSLHLDHYRAVIGLRRTALLALSRLLMRRVSGRLKLH